MTVEQLGTFNSTDERHSTASEAEGSSTYLDPHHALVSGGKLGREGYRQTLNCSVDESLHLERASSAIKRAGEPVEFENATTVKIQVIE